MNIVNPAPVTSPGFTKEWLASATLYTPPTGKATLHASFLPWDGTHTLSNPVTVVNIGDVAAKAASDTAFAAWLTALKADIATRSKNTTPFRNVNIFAPDSTKPVVVEVIWPTVGTTTPTYRIVNAFALAATDPAFAAVLTSTLTELSTLAGLTIAAD